MTSQDQNPPTPEEIAQHLEEEAEILNKMDDQNRIACSPEIKGLIYPDEGRGDRDGKIIVTAIQLDHAVSRVPLHNLFEPGRAITVEFTTYSGVLYRKGSNFMLISSHYDYPVFFKVLDIIEAKCDEWGRARHSIEAIRYLEGVD